MLSIHLEVFIKRLCEAITAYKSIVFKPGFTLVNFPSGYILKPQAEEYAALPELEYLIMNMASAVGIKTVPYALLELSTEFAYITKRIDRENGQYLAMEDFCQLDERLTEDNPSFTPRKSLRRPFRGVLRKLSNRIQLIRIRV